MNEENATDQALRDGVTRALAAYDAPPGMVGRVVTIAEVHEADDIRLEVITSSDCRAWHVLGMLDAAYYDAESALEDDD